MCAAGEQSLKYIVANGNNYLWLMITKKFKFEKKNMTKKQFDVYASLAKPGDTFMMQKAGSWEIGKGWDNYHWIEAIFVSYDGKEVVFENKLPPNRRTYVTFNRQVKTGEVRIIWDRLDIFTITKPTDFEDNNVVKLWNPGELKFYK